MADRTVIRGLSWCVAWRGDRHRYARDADIAFEGDRIVHAGGRFEGAADREIDGAGLMAMPGFVNIHGHLGTEPLGKGFYEELGSHKLHMSRIYEHIYTVRPDLETRPVATRFSIAELMKSGCTTVADMSLPYPGWLDTVAGTGVRAFIAPMFRSGAWRTPNDHSVVYDWNEAQGERDMQEALDICEEARRHPSGRLDGIVIPAQAETCTPELMKKAHAQARARGLHFQTHAAQAVHEFQEMVRRHGMTPVAYLEDLGVLGPGTSIAHGIFLDEHPATLWHERRDLARLARSGTTVIHCPVTFAYRGVAMHSLAGYRAAGVPLAMGTDTFPHDMLNEMRIALFLSKVVTAHVDALRLEHVFGMATVGAARAMGRDDLGRLAPGAKADIVLVDCAHPAMTPCRDPLRSLVFSAGSAAVRDVFVDGRPVLEGGEPVHIDLAADARALEAGHARSMEDTRNRDRAGRAALEISPLALETDA